MLIARSARHQSLLALNNGIERLIKKIVAGIPSRACSLPDTTHFTECNQTRALSAINGYRSAHDCTCMVDIASHVGAETISRANVQCSI